MRYILPPADWSCSHPTSSVPKLKQRLDKSHLLNDSGRIEIVIIIAADPGSVSIPLNDVRAGRPYSSLPGGIRIYGQVEGGKRPTNAYDQCQFLNHRSSFPI